MTNSTGLSLQKYVIFFWKHCLRLIHLWPFVKIGTGLKRLHPLATAWVVTRVTAVLKKIWKHKPLYRRRNSDVVEFRAYNYVFERWQPFLLHHINGILTPQESLSYKVQLVTNFPIFSITYRPFHNSSTLGHSPSQCNDYPHARDTHLRTDHPSCLFPLVSPTIFLSTLIARICATCNTHPILLISSP
jgi:hypothetical protein